MFVNPVLIVGAPRSGTSLLQKIIRDHPAFWSLPSESDFIWDRHCHPELRGWESEQMDVSDLTREARDDILEQFEFFSMPARVWRTVERTNAIWSFSRNPRLRRLLRMLYLKAFPLLKRSRLMQKPKRLLEKTASNCFRLGYVLGVFHDAKIIYPVRDGRNSVNSLINGWQHPTRFFTYPVPVELGIEGYSHRGWKFVLPPGWRKYTHRSLEEVCAFQWIACNDFMLAESAKPQLRDRMLQVRLEDLASEPERVLRQLAGFIELPFDDYFKRLCRTLPVVNSPDNDVTQDKWKRQNGVRIGNVMTMIEPMMHRLGYRK